MGLKEAMFALAHTFIKLLKQHKENSHPPNSIAYCPINEMKIAIIKKIIN